MRKSAFLLAATLLPFVPTSALTASDEAPAAQPLPRTGVVVPTSENASGSREPIQLEELRRRVRNGDPEAQVTLAKILFEEQPRRVEEGMHWLRKAAERDYAQAQRLYAWRLLELRGKDAGEEAVDWLARAANQGDVESQYDLGLILYKGNFVPRDPVAAVQWILLATDSGHSEARRLLKEMELLLSPKGLAEARKRNDAFKTALREAATGEDN
jgi:TPR repeat protein